MMKQANLQNFGFEANDIPLMIETSSHFLKYYHSYFPR